MLGVPLFLALIGALMMGGGIYAYTALPCEDREQDTPPAAVALGIATCGAVLVIAGAALSFTLPT